MLFSLFCPERGRRRWRIDRQGGGFYAWPMRWDALFTDMESQFAESGTLAVEAEISERSRMETASVILVDRLRGSVDSHVAVHLLCGRIFEGTLSHAGADALVLNEARHQVLIPYGAVARYSGLGRLSLAEPSPVRRRVGLSKALRGMARDRAGLSVTLRSGPSGHNVLTGVIDRVGSDFFDLALVGQGEVRRTGHVLDVATIPFGSLGAIRSLRSAEM